MRHPLSVIIIARNEQRNISRCLTSVAWADEVVVVDAESNDDTRKLAEEGGARVVRHAWEGFGRQKAFALAQAKHEWVLSLDADEVVTPELKGEISSVLQSASTAAGYQIPRRSYFLGRWMRHGGWYPGFQLRLFRKVAAHVNVRAVHEGFEVEGGTGRLNSPLDHFTYDSLEHYLSKVNDYTSLEVADRVASRSGGRVRWFHFLLSPLSHFLRMFVSLGGWKDGIRGFLLAVYSSLYTLLAYAKTWEYQTSAVRGMELPPVTSEAVDRWKARY